MHEKEKEILLQLWQVHKVIVFYLKIMDEWKGKNDQQIFRDQIFRKFRGFVLKILKILQLYDFKIKIVYCTILLGNMNT